MENIVITIARQIGSGGYDLAREISLAFNFKLIDREIVANTAKILKTDVSYLDKKEEKVSSLLDTVLGAFAFGSPEVGSLTNAFYPSDIEIFKTQSRVLKDFASKYNIVALGRVSFFVFKDHPNHFSIFIKANLDYRVKNVAKGFKISEDKALELINKTDQNRNDYTKKMTGINRCDLRNYDVVFDISAIGFDLVKSVIFDILRKKFLGLINGKS